MGANRLAFSREKQDKIYMPVLQKPKHEKFAQLVATGMSCSEAYRKAGYRDASAKHNATRMRDNEVVARRIAEIRGENDRKSEMSRQELIDILVRFIRDPALCVWPARIKSAELLAKLCGWHEAERVNVTIDPLQSLIDSIRARMENGAVLSALADQRLA